MQHYFREWNFSRSRRVEMKNVLTFGFFIVAVCLIVLLKNIDAWSEYQQAKMNAHTFRSTMCRIEDIIVEEIRSDANNERKTTSIKGFFLLRVVNSTNKQDEFRLEEVPLQHKPGQDSLVSSLISIFNESFLGKCFNNIKSYK